MQWSAIFQKELLQAWRNKKMIWMPLVIMLLSVMDMITYYYLPQIIELSGGVPEGMDFGAPDLNAFDAFQLSLNALSQYGVLVIVLAAMGMIQSEVKTGEIEIIMTKPVKSFNYLSGKWAVANLLTISSLLLSILLAAYYTFILYGTLSMTYLFLAFFFFSFWYIFVVTLVLFYNTFIKNNLAIAAATIGTLAVMSIVNSAIGHKLTWFPNQLSDYILEMILNEKIPSQLWGTSFIILILIGVLLYLANLIFKHRTYINN